MALDKPEVFCLIFFLYEIVPKQIHNKKSRGLEYYFRTTLICHNIFELTMHDIFDLLWA